jgi:hypothetical protein
LFTPGVIIRDTKRLKEKGFGISASYKMNEKPILETEANRLLEGGQVTGKIVLIA